MGYWDIFYARYLKETDGETLFFPYGLLKRQGFKVPDNEINHVKKIIRNYLIFFLVIVGIYGNNIDIENWRHFHYNIMMLIIITLVWKSIQLTHFKLLCRNFSPGTENFSAVQVNIATTKAMPWWVLILSTLIIGGLCIFSWVIPLDINANVLMTVQLSSSVLFAIILSRLFYKLHVLFSEKS